MHILLITDTWEPQVNGVVTTIRYLVHQLERERHRVTLIHPAQYATVSLFCNKSVRLVTRPWKIIKRIHDAKADGIHIFTEGPLGICARLVCGWMGIPFTTSYHTRFPEFIEIYLGIPKDWIYPLLNW